jgi:hypothetical protein
MALTNLYTYHYQQRLLEAVYVDKELLHSWHKNEWLSECVDYSKPFGVLWISEPCGEANKCVFSCRADCKYNELVYGLVQQESPDRDPVIIDCPVSCTTNG